MSIVTNNSIRSFNWQTKTKCVRMKRDLLGVQHPIIDVDKIFLLKDSLWGTTTV